MAALVAVMIMVSVGTFDWHSIPTRPVDGAHQALRALGARPPVAPL
jgi:MFS superfamily sulfate permease-like transporter